MANTVKAYVDAHGGAKPKVVVIGTPDPSTSRFDQVVASYLSQAGFDASSATIDQAQQISGAIAGDFQIQAWRNHPGSDPGTQYVWWRSGYPTNFGGINDPVIDCLLDVGRSGASEAACLKDPKLNASYDADLPSGFEPLNQIDPDDEKAIYQAVSLEFKKQAWNIWGGYAAWSVATKPNVHGIFASNNPDGSKADQALVNGTPAEALWVS